MREYGAEAVTLLVLEALNFDHKPPLVANSVGDKNYINCKSKSLRSKFRYFGLKFLEDELLCALLFMQIIRIQSNPSIIDFVCHPRQIQAGKSKKGLTLSG